MNAELIKMSVALGSLSDGTPDAITRLAAAVSRFAELDKSLMTYAIDEDRSGIARTEETDAAFEEADRLIDGLPALAAEVFLYYNDEVEDDASGRLRLEVPGTPWDCTNPLRFH